MMNHITEILPELDKMPVWAREAFEAGQFFDVAFKRVERLEAENKALRDQVAAMVEGLELQNNAVDGTPEDLKATCQIIALAAKKIEGKIKT